MCLQTLLQRPCNGFLARNCRFTQPSKRLSTKTSNTSATHSDSCLMQKPSIVNIWNLSILHREHGMARNLIKKEESFWGLFRLKSQDRSGCQRSQVGWLEHLTLVLQSEIYWSPWYMNATAVTPLFDGWCSWGREVWNAQTWSPRQPGLKPVVPQEQIVWRWIFKLLQAIVSNDIKRMGIALTESVQDCMVRAKVHY